MQVFGPAFFYLSGPIRSMEIEHTMCVIISKLMEPISLQLVIPPSIVDIQDSYMSKFVVLLSIFREKLI